MKQRLMVLAVMSCAILLAGQAFAQGPGRGMGPGGGFGAPGMMLGNLDLTDAQKEQVKTLTTAFRTAVEPFRTQLRDLSQEMRTATANGAFNEAQVRTIAENQAKVNVEITVASEKLRSEIYAILTPEQRAKVDEEQTQMQRGMRRGQPRDR